MKIIQFVIGPDTQTWQSRLLGLGDDGVIYVESPIYDCNGDLVDGRQWVEFKINSPRKK